MSQLFVFKTNIPHIQRQFSELSHIFTPDQRVFYVVFLL